MVEQMEWIIRVQPDAKGAKPWEEPLWVPVGIDAGEYAQAVVDEFNIEEKRRAQAHKGYPAETRRFIAVVKTTGKVRNLVFCNPVKVTGMDGGVYHCKDCGMYYYRPGVEPLKPAPCRPGQVCGLCNESFVTAADLDTHNALGEHHRPDWAPANPEADLD